MAKVKVSFMVAMTQVIDWPDDELEDLTPGNLKVNLDPEEAQISDYDHTILEVTVNGKRHHF